MSDEKPFAHSPSRPGGEWHLLSEHLAAVASMSAEFVKSLEWPICPCSPTLGPTAGCSQ